MLRPAILLAASLLAAPALAAELVTVPLDLGDGALSLCDDDDFRFAFDAGRELTDVTQVSLRVTATYSVARSICWLFGNYGGGVWSYNGDVGLYVGLVDTDAVVCRTRHEFAPTAANEVVDLELVLHCGDGATVRRQVGAVHWGRR